MPRPTPYTIAENEILRALYATASRADLLAALPTRSLASIRCQVVRMKLRKAPPMVLWAKEEDALLRSLYHQEGPQRIARKLNRTPQGVKRRAMKLGVTDAENLAPRLPRVMPPATHNPARQTAHTLKPLAVGAQLEPVKRSPETPILNARADSKRRAESAENQKPKPFVTAEQVRSLSAAHPARWAYTAAAHKGPAAATEAFYAALNQSKQAA